MTTYMVLLPAPEQEWAHLSAEEHEKGARAHERFNRELREGGHKVLASNPLTPSADAISMRPDGKGGATITDGPFSESVEQIVGFYLIESGDKDDLVRVCAQLASTGDLIELRELASMDAPPAVPACPDLVDSGAAKVGN